MPEGDTVWLTGRHLETALVGRRLVRGDLRVPEHATADLAGRQVLAVLTRGKHLLIRLSGDLTLHTHLGMEGNWRVYPVGHRWRGGPTWQIRALLVTDHHAAVGYRLPVVDLLPTSAERRVVGHLGPDLLAADWDPQRALANLAADPHREIGLALLDQQVLAGLGNLYRVEVCFLRGISPWTPVGRVGNLPAVIDLSHRLLQANRNQWEQSTTGARARGETHWVFERSGLPCRRCAATVRTAPQGEPPTERVTYWCPSCQPGPAPAGRGLPARTWTQPPRRSGPGDSGRPGFSRTQRWSMSAPPPPTPTG